MTPTNNLLAPVLTKVPPYGAAPVFRSLHPGLATGTFQNRGHYYGISTGSVLGYKQQMVPVVWYWHLINLKLAGYAGTQYKGTTNSSNCTFSVIVPAWEGIGSVKSMALLQTAVWKLTT